MLTFHRSLSEETVHLRYFGFPGGEALVAHERLVQICFSDYDREIALIVEAIQAAEDQRQIIAVARLIKVYGANEAEVANVISDDWQGKGLGAKLLGELVAIGRVDGLERIVGYILPENYVMQRICRKLGFTLRYDRFEDAMEARCLDSNHWNFVVTSYGEAPENQAPDIADGRSYQDPGEAP